MFIAGLGVALPEQCYAQAECWETVRDSPHLSALGPRSRALLKKVLLSNNGIATRHLALDKLDEAFNLSPDILHARFCQHAPRLATESAQNALAQAGIAAQEIDGLIISTCTGYLCPGLTSYVSQALGLRSDALLLDVVGQGCGAALPNLNAAAGLVDAGQCEHVLSICVEKRFIWMMIRACWSVPVYLPTGPGPRFARVAPVCARAGWSGSNQ